MATNKLVDKTTLQYFLGKVKALIDVKVDKVTGKGLSTNDYTTEEKTKLAGIANNATKIEIDANLNTTGKAADAKATGDALATKVDKVTGKSLSTEDYTTAEKTKLSGIAAGATNVVIDNTVSITGQAADAGAVRTALNGKINDVTVNSTSVVSNGVANIPLASDTNLGVVKVDESYGFRIDENGILKINAASDSNIKQGTNSYRPVASNHVHEAAFYGLAKAAGDSTQASSNNAVGTYTDGAKTAIKTMLGAGMTVSTLSGTIVTQTGAENTFYVCGTLDELTFTAPASGICGIRLTSGSTPTVLSVSGVTYWMNNFDPTAALKASKTYEINILDGVGVVGC